ncbi:MAG TPA: cysteine desulfurase-like protein [Solirubrobacteraceae bacterium]
MNRRRFPGLADGWARLDGAAGTQPVDSVIEAIDVWLRSGRVANDGGRFAASAACDALVADARRAIAELLAADPEGVVFGPSMTALTFAFSRAVARTLQPGDEIVCTRLDHDANVTPWLAAARDSGATVRFAEPDPDTLELPVEAVEQVLGPRTRWVATTAASNAVGTMPDLAAVAALTHEQGAQLFVDAVHATPHRRLDVVALDCDALACSAYKWFGPHLSVLWARPRLLAELTPERLRPASDGVPERWEQGTSSFETLAGVVAAADYLLTFDWARVRAHEQALFAQLLDGLAAIDGVTLFGHAGDRAPTAMFTVDGRTSAQVAEQLAAERIAVWHGTYYAWELFRLLGLERDGAVRASIVHYNDASDVERLVNAVAAVADGH